jgi:hypothetical protein
MGIETERGVRPTRKLRPPAVASARTTCAFAGMRIRTTGAAPAACSLPESADASLKPSLTVIRMRPLVALLNSAAGTVVVPENPPIARLRKLRPHRPSRSA